MLHMNHASNPIASLATDQLLSKDDHHHSFRRKGATQSPLSQLGHEDLRLILPL